MKKVVIFKNKKLTEDTPDLRGAALNISKGDRRIIRVRRAAEAAEEAAIQARQHGNEETAVELEDRAAALRQWAKEAAEDDYTGKGQNSRNDAENSETAQSSAKNSPEEEVENSNKPDQDNKKDGTTSDVSDAKLDTEKDAAEGANIESELDHSLGNQQGNSDSKEAKKASSNNTQSNDSGEKSEDAGNGKTTDTATAKQKADGAEKGSEENSEKTAEENSEEESEEIEKEGSSEEESEGSSSEEKNRPKDSKENSTTSGTPKSQDNSQNKSSKPQANPFKVPPRGAEPSSSSSSEQPEEPKNKEERMKAMLAVLKQLKNGEQAGAKDALQNILSQVNQAQSTKEALQEAFTLPNISLNDISDDELDEVINSIYLEVDKVKPINRSTPMDVRIAEIERTSAKDAEDINIEDNSVLKDERAAARARKKSIAAYNSVANLGGLAAFKQSLWRAIKSQVSKVDADDTSWGVINRRHQDDDIVAPGSYTDEINRKNSIPAIRVYFDCSGSFNEDDINKVKNVLAVLDEFEQQKKITTELIYFADHLHSTYAAARDEGGTDAWPYIVDDLQKSAPTNVIIITDRDMYWDAKSLGQSYVANGCVWYIWKKSKADNLPEYVKGRKGTYEFQLD